MKLYLFKKTILLMFLFSLLIPFLTWAITFEPPFQTKTFEEIINAIIDFIFLAAMAIVPIMIIIAAFYFLTSGGNPEQVSKAKKIILYTFIGLFIVFLGKGIPGIIRQILEGGPPGPPPPPPCASFTNSNDCANGGCEWCWGCGGLNNNEINQWRQDKCVDLGTDCGYACIAGECSTPKPCSIVEKWDWAECGCALINPSAKCADYGGYCEHAPDCNAPEYCLFANKLDCTVYPALCCCVPPSPCLNFTTRNDCEAGGCKWCFKCSGYKVNSWKQDKCVDSGTDCGYDCGYLGECGAPASCDSGYVWNWGECNCIPTSTTCATYEGYCELAKDCDAPWHCFCSNCLNCTTYPALCCCVPP